MKYLSRHCCIAALALLMAAPAMAQEFRVGLVSLDRILREANGAKAAQAKLEQEFSRREKELGDVGAALKASSERFEREAPTLSEAQRAQRQKQLIDQDRDFQRKRRELQEDANARKNEELQQLIEKSNRVIKQLAEQEKYDLVIQDAVYINPKHDITDKVIRALNAAK